MILWFNNFFRSSPKEQRRSTSVVPTGDSEGEDDTEKLTQKPNLPNPDVDGFDNHDEFTRWLIGWRCLTAY